MAAASVYKKFSYAEAFNGNSPRSAMYLERAGAEYRRAGNYFAAVAQEYEGRQTPLSAEAARLRVRAAAAFKRAGDKEEARRQYDIAGEDLLDLASGMKVERSFRLMAHYRRVLGSAIRYFKKAGDEKEVNVARTMILDMTEHFAKDNFVLGNAVRQ